MKFNLRTASLRFFLLVLFFGLAACGKEPAPPAPAPAKVVTKPKDVSITGVHIGLGIGEHNHVAQEQDTFAPTDTIVISVYSDGWAKTATIAVKLVTAEGSLLMESKQDVVYEGSLATAFSFSRPEGFAVGSYKAEAYLNDWKFDTVKFEVK